MVNLIVYILLVIKLIISLNNALPNYYEKDQQDLFIVRKSYEEVVALIERNFNEKCNLYLHNCLFQNQWERIFGRSSSSSTFMFTKQQQQQQHQLNYCQAFLVAHYCINENIKKYLPDTNECLNDINGNRFNYFKQDIYRQQCNTYYKLFFNDNQLISDFIKSSSSSSSSSLIQFINNYCFLLLILLFYLVTSI